MDSQKTVVITGATSGLGEAAAIAYAKQGFSVIALGRDAARGEALEGRIRAGGGQALFLASDLFTVRGVRQAAAAIRARTETIDVLVNNAGGMFSKRVETSDGIERTVALNLVAPFVLTEGLLAQLSRASGRVVNLVTNIPNRAQASMDELFGDEGGAGIGAYTRAKLALLAITREQQDRYAAFGITAVSLHPGIIPGTGFGQDLPAWLRRFGAFIARIFRFASTTDQAAERYLSVGTGHVEGGAYHHEGARADGPRLGRDRAFAQSVWAELERVTSAPGTRRSVGAAQDVPPVVAAHAS